jgi:hypothetical protein
MRLETLTRPPSARLASLASLVAGASLLLALAGCGQRAVAPTNSAAGPTNATTMAILPAANMMASPAPAQGLAQPGSTQQATADAPPTSAPGGDDGAVFDKNLHDSCFSTASAKGGPAAAETYCSCIVVQLDQVPVQQRIALSATSDEVTHAESYCNAQASGGR